MRIEKASEEENTINGERKYLKKYRLRISYNYRKENHKMKRFKNISGIYKKNPYFVI